MSGEIARAALDGARVAITPDCWPCRGTAECIRVSMTKQTWNGVRTLNRKIPVGMTPEQMDEAIARTVEEMTAAIETPGNWKG